ncbi:hypothetical protein AALB39_09175 [Lachnospiraceae bacterium 54-53]
MKRISDNLKRMNGNHIFPLFWQQGEEEGILCDYMEKIDRSGIKAVCVEARPHPDFLGKQWWHDMDILLREAKKRQMNIWILVIPIFPPDMPTGPLKISIPSTGSGIQNCISWILQVR